MTKGLEDYKFVYKISCEPKISPNQDITTIAQKIIGIRVKMFDEMSKKLLKEIAEEKGYTELLVIDENKVDTFVKALKALEIIKKCFYVAKSSGAILLTDYGFEHKEELKEVLL